MHVDTDNSTFTKQYQTALVREADRRSNTNQGERCEGLLNTKKPLLFILFEVQTETLEHYCINITVSLTSHCPPTLLQNNSFAGNLYGANPTAPTLSFQYMNEETCNFWSECNL